MHAVMQLPMQMGLRVAGEELPRPWLGHQPGGWLLTGLTPPGTYPLCLNHHTVSLCISRNPQPAKDSEKTRLGPCALGRVARRHSPLPLRPAALVPTSEGHCSPFNDVQAQLAAMWQGEQLQP